MKTALICIAVIYLIFEITYQSINLVIRHKKRQFEKQYDLESEEIGVKISNALKPFIQDYPTDSEFPPEFYYVRHVDRGLAIFYGDPYITQPALMRMAQAIQVRYRTMTFVSMPDFDYRLKGPHRPIDMLSRYLKEFFAGKPVYYAPVHNVHEIFNEVEY